MRANEEKKDRLQQKGRMNQNTTPGALWGTFWKDKLLCIFRPHLDYILKDINKQLKLPLLLLEWLIIEMLSMLHQMNNLIIFLMKFLLMFSS